MIKSINISGSIHFVGIGGSGVSGLALILKRAGYIVSGSDEKATPNLKTLEKEGIKVFTGHNLSNISADTGLVIYSAAIPQNNPELLGANTRNIPCISYSRAVGLLTKDFETICVCGTHGKTTTTAMAAAAFIKCSMDPSVIVGASVPELGGKSSRLGEGRHLILESCEHFRSFLDYSPSHIILTNIELDHLDYYKDLDDYKCAYEKFLSKLPPDGLLAANGDDENVLDVIKKLKHEKTVLYGGGSNNLYRISGNEIFYKGKKIFGFDLKIPGLHNIYNAAAVFALCHELGFDMFAAANALNNFTGAARRFEIRGQIGKTTVIDDYAHHPSEISATLNSLRRKYGADKKVLCVFQPHQYSRTHHLLENFADSFDDADEIIISDILRVRDSDEDVKKINPEKFIKKMSEKHGNVRYGGGLPKIISSVKPEMRKFDVIITMGAGDVWKVADALVKTEP